MLRIWSCRSSLKCLGISFHWIWNILTNNSGLIYVEIKSILGQTKRRMRRLEFPEFLELSRDRSGSWPDWLSNKKQHNSLKSLYCHDNQIYLWSSSTWYFWIDNNTLIKDWSKFNFYTNNIAGALYNKVLLIGYIVDEPITSWPKISLDTHKRGRK